MKQMFFERKSGHHYIKDINPKHVWRVSYNPANGVFFLENRRTGLRYERLASKFVMFSIGYDEWVRTLPNYVHQQVWFLHGTR